MLELNYKTFGQGDPIIILHGMFGTLDNWQTIARQLAEEYTVYLIDQRNHGRSPHHDDFNYPVLAEDLHHFMESHWIHHAHIIGHSMGGKTAMQFALDYSDMVDKLIVVDIAPKNYKGGHQVIFDALFSVDLEKMETRKEVDTKLAELIDEVGVRQFLMKNLTRKKEGGFTWKMNLPVIYKNYQAILGTIENTDTFEEPTLFIRGERSKYILDEDEPLLKEFFPNAELATVAGAGHWVHAEAPKVLLEMMEEFLGR